MVDRELRVGERRPGGRAARVRESVLAATIEALVEVGYDALSVEDVARRAGVHKTTVYRRWPTRAALVAEATRDRSQQVIPVPDTGTLLGDLRQLARDVVASLTTEVGARLAHTIVVTAGESAEVSEVAHAYWAERLALTAVVVERAIARGEVAPGTDPGLVVETLVGPLFVRLLLTGEPLDAGFADAAAELVAAGVTTSSRRS